MVAPRRGAWIETCINHSSNLLGFVAPRRGAWIETLLIADPGGAGTKSHPAGVRGLKPITLCDYCYGYHVAPRRGAWIETFNPSITFATAFRRTPQGCVD